MSQLHICLVALILLTVSGIAADIPFVFDEESLNLASNDSLQLEKVSGSSRYLKGVSPISSQGKDFMIEVTLAANESINKSSGDDRTSESQKNLSDLAAFSQTFMYDADTYSQEGFETDLPPSYSLTFPVTEPSVEDYWFEEGNKNYNNSDYKKAIECYNKALKLNPQSKEVWCNRGIALCRLGEYQDAIEAFDQAILISSHYSKAWRSKGRALEAMGLENEAEKAFRNAG